MTEKNGEFRSIICVVRNILRRKPSQDLQTRIQLDFLSYFEENLEELSKEKIIIAADFPDAPNIKEAFSSYEELSKLIHAVSQLAKIDLRLPEISIDEESTNAIHIRKLNDETFRVSIAEPIKYKFTADQESADDEAFQFLLKNIFGHEKFRPGQMLIIKNALTRADTLGILPAGVGKSLCYQFVTLLQPRSALFIAPTNALIRDQYRILERDKIIQSTFISSDISSDDRTARIKDFMLGKYQLMLISSELAQYEEFRTMLAESKISTAVIDEIHCLSEWSHDFRFSYSQLIPTIRECCRDVTLLGLTGTASQAVLDDIKSNFDDVKAFTLINRDDFEFRRMIFRSDSEREDSILKIARQQVGTYTSRDVRKNRVGMIFSDDNCSRIQEVLSQHGTNVGDVEIFDKTLTFQEKIDAQKKFMDDEFFGVMVCDSEFGIGIDKENVKFTIHASLPPSIESFYQESGRAGRDEDKSEKSTCYIMLCPETIDRKIIAKIFDRSTSEEDRNKLQTKLTNDLGKILFRWNLNHDTIENEIQDVHAVLSALSQSSNDNSTTIELSQKNQNAIYKLYLLGIVKSWTVSDSALLKIKHAEKLEEIEIQHSLEKYIRKHDSEFSLTGKIKQYDHYYKIFNSSPNKISNMIRLLITWTHENVNYNRLQSLYNIFHLCSEDISNEEFQSRLSNYFRYTDEVVIFDSIVQCPLDFKNWFTVLNQNPSLEDFEPIDVKTAEKKLFTLSRYLESYGNNTGLNFLSGMLRLICGNFEDSEGEWRLESSFQNIKESPADSDQNTILDLTLQIGKTLAMNEKNLLSCTIDKIYPEILDQIQESLEDEYSLAIMIEGYTARIHKVLEENANGLF